MFEIDWRDRIKLWAHGYFTELSIAGCYQHGQIVRRDVAGAIQLYQKAIAEGKLKGHYLLGGLYEEHGHVEQAIKLYFRGAHQQEPLALNRLRALAETGVVAAHYYLGRVSEYNGKISEAEHFYKQAAQARHADAIFRLGELYVRRKNLGAALLWYKKACLENHAEALDILNRHARENPVAALYMAELYETNDSAPAANPEQAKAYYLRSTRLGNKDAAFRLGELAKSENIQEACEYYVVAAKRGHGIALSTLQNLAATDLLEAQYALHCYYAEIGDIAHAIEWAMRVADKQDERARKYLDDTAFSAVHCLQIARWYESGHAGKVDLLRALRYYHRASVLGNKPYIILYYM